MHTQAPRSARRSALQAGSGRWPRWLAGLVFGSLAGLGLRLMLFLAAAGMVRWLAEVGGLVLALSPAVDPVYTRAALNSLADLHVQGLAVIGPLGDWLHAAAPNLFVDSARAHWAPIRVAVQPGSPVLGRLVAAGVAHAGVLGCGLLLVRAHWRRRPSLVLAGVAMQVQVALGILGAQPSVRELESTGVSFAANALLPWLALRGQSLSGDLAGAWPPLVAGLLVGLALLVGYLPAAVLLVCRGRATRIACGTAVTVVLSSAACAGVIRNDISVTSALAPVAAAPSEPTFDLPTLAPPAAQPMLLRDRWFDEAQTPQPPAASRVEVQGSNAQFQYLVNGEPQVIKGMGLNTQYTQLLDPPERAARLEADMLEYTQLGVNTVLGWDPAEFDDVLLEAAQRHAIGVVMPFDLDPQADYTDPTVRQTLHGQVLAWVARYRNAPAVRMWGLGNEVLHKIVHPAWVGPQDPRREQNAEAFSDWLVQTADDIHALDPDHPVTYRSAEDAFVDWVAAAFQRAGGGPRPWFVWGTNCYQEYLSDIVDRWPDSGLPTALWVSEFAPGGMAVPDRPDGFQTMWGYVRRHPEWVLGGAVYAWTRNGPEGVDQNFGLTDDGVPVDGRSLDMLTELFHSP